MHCLETLTRLNAEAVAKHEARKLLPPWHKEGRDQSEDRQHETVVYQETPAGTVRVTPS